MSNPQAELSSSDPWRSPPKKWLPSKSSTDGSSVVEPKGSPQELAPFGIATFHRLPRRLRASPSAGLDELCKWPE